MNGLKQTNGRIDEGIDGGINGSTDEWVDQYELV